MKILQKITFFLTRQCVGIPRHFQCTYRLQHLATMANTTLFPQQNTITFNKTAPSKRFLHESNGIDEDDLADFHGELDIDEFFHQQPSSVRNLLYGKQNDPLLTTLNSAASVQEVLDFIKQNETQMQYTHVVQAILVLWDLQKIFYRVNSINEASHKELQKSMSVARSYVSQLMNHENFQKLLKLLVEKHAELDVEALSCALLYLNKIGLDTKHEVLGLLTERCRKALDKEFTLAALSRLTVTIFHEGSLAPYFIVQESFPKLLAELERCNSAEDFKLITICLNNLHRIVSDNIMKQYTSKVQQLIDNATITAKDYRTILKIIMFLSYPQWNIHNSELISQCILLLRNKLHILSVYELLTVYEVFCKLQEPGCMLNELQHTASKYLQLDESCFPLEIKLKLLASIVCFSSATQRQEHEKLVMSFVKEPLTEHSFTELYKLLTYIKPGAHICKIFWDNVLRYIESNGDANDNEMLLNICIKYMNFHSDVQFRHRGLEAQILKLIERELMMGISSHIPSKFSTLAAFSFAYSSDAAVIKHIADKIVEIWEQFNYSDCLSISKGLRFSKEITRNGVLDPLMIMQVNTAINNCTENKLTQMRLDIKKINFLVKSYIYRNKIQSNQLEELLVSYQKVTEISSKSIRNIAFALQTTNALLPDLIDNMVEYTLKSRDNILGYNAESIVYLCYYFGYLPKKSEAFFEAVTDIIIRDQERMSGLSYLQASLALCFFHRLPDSFIKNIFNVEFLEKLDVELANCYFKDVYPLRVRNNMMQLNRAVCLDYPQSSVPWFHQKYIEQFQTKTKGLYKETDFAGKIKAYLLQLVETPDCLQQDIISPYGYHIDFVIHLDENEQVVPIGSNKTRSKIAILPLNSTKFTRMAVQLKGHVQLKKRHLEILGYKVIMISYNEWKTLVYGAEKCNYLANLIWPEKAIQTAVVR